MIDDGVIAVKLDPRRSQESKEATAKKIVDFVIAVYAKLGYQIEAQKTIASLIKFTFLNRIFISGSEVIMPLKTAMKIDRDLSKRMSGVFEQVDEIMNSGRGCLVKGADYLVTYIMSVHRAVEILY